MRVVELSDATGRVVCGRCRLADSFSTRLLGLLGRRELAPDEGLLIRPASSIHTAFMRFAIDAVFLDAAGDVVRVAPNLKPWRLATRRGAGAVLELPAGAAERLGIREGDRIA